MSETSSLILPEDPEFQTTLGRLPFFWQQIANQGNGFNFAVDAETGLFKVLNHRETIEYLYGGEYESRLEQMGYEAAEEDEFSGLCNDLDGVEEVYIDF